MTEFIFATLEAVGFTHPLHPAITHIPMGMVMGCFFFGLIALYLKSDKLRATAFHCAILALVFIIPTIFTGYLDWQYIYNGTFTFFIKLKMILAVVLPILLTLSIVLNLRKADQKTIFIIYCLCLATAIGLGFSGGEVQHG